MATFYAWQIETELLRLMRTLPAPMQLSPTGAIKMVQAGTLRPLLVSGVKFDTFIDGILVECQEIPMEWGRAIREAEITYRFRIVHLHKLAAAEIEEQVKLERAAIIAKKILDNVQLRDDASAIPTIAGLRINWCKPVKIDLDPPENTVFDTPEQLVCVFAVHIEVATNETLI